MIRHKHFSYPELIKKLETLKSSMVIVDDTNDIFERCTFGDLRGKAIGLSNNQIAYVDKNKELDVVNIIEKVYTFDKFVYENFSLETFEKHFNEYLKEILQGEPITEKSIKNKFLSKFSEKLVPITHGKQVFGLNITLNREPFSIGGFDFYFLPSSIGVLQEKYKLSQLDLETIKNLPDNGTWIFKTLEGYDREKVKQLIDDDIRLFVYALQFTANEFNITNVNLSDNIKDKYLNSFTFENYQSADGLMYLNTDVYSKRTLTENDKKEYSKLWVIFEKHPDKRKEIEKCILRAISWVAKSSVEPMVEVAITECFIALETLFDGKQNNGEITKVLKCLADKCLDKSKHDYDIKKVIGKCYDIRSRISHGHDKKYTETHKGYLVVIAKEIIIFVLNNYENLSITNGKDLLNWVKDKS